VSAKGLGYKISMTWLEEAGLVENSNVSMLFMFGKWQAVRTSVYFAYVFLCR
jgi:hypothetical protein